MSVEWQKNSLVPAVMQNRKIKKSHGGHEEDVPPMKAAANASIMSRYEDECDPMMSPEERVKKINNFTKCHAETRRRSALLDYGLSGASIGGLSGYLMRDGKAGTPKRPYDILIGAAIGGGFGIALGQIAVPWVAQSEAQALCQGDELGIKSYGYSDYIERDNIGMPGSNMLSSLITGKLLFGK